MLVCYGKDNVEVSQKNNSISRGRLYYQWERFFGGPKADFVLNKAEDFFLFAVLEQATGKTLGNQFFLC